MKAPDLRKQKFERLTVLRFAGRDKRGHSLWKCRCSCKRKVIVQGGHLRSGHSRSCGCLRIERTRKHGQSGGKNKPPSPTYSSYRLAKQRCQNPKATGFRHYGGRGILFLFDSFPEFYAALGPRPPGMTLDRIDTNGNYTLNPLNVRWASWEVQNNNQRPRKQPPKKQPARVEKVYAAVAGK